MNKNKLRVFALDTDLKFGEDVVSALDIPLGRFEVRQFEDGEHKIRPLENVRGADVFVIHSLYSDTSRSVNDKLVQMLFMLGALRDAAAARITAVAPYLCYARKDRKTKSRDPVNTRYVAQLFEAVGVDQVLTMDVHNLAAYQNAFRCGTDHLEAKGLFLSHFTSMLQNKPVAVASPDVGGIKRAEAFRQALQQKSDQQINSVFMEKHRSSGKLSGSKVVGTVEGKTVLIVDDLIVSGATLSRTAEACIQHGATAVLAAASHGVFTADANDKLNAEGLNEIAITNSVPPFRLTAAQIRNRLTILNAAPLFAEAIKRIHLDGSIVELLSL